MSYNTQQRRGWGRAGAACFANRLFSINFPLETLRKNSLTPPRTTPPTAQKGAREPRPQAERRLPTASSSGPRLLVSQAPARPTARRAREIRLRSPAVRPQSPDTAQRPGPQGPGGAFPKAQQKLVQPEGRSPRREGAHEGKVSASTARLRPPLRGGTGVCGPLPAAWPHNREAAPFLSPSPQHDPPYPHFPELSGHHGDRREPHGHHSVHRGDDAPGSSASVLIAVGVHCSEVPGPRERPLPGHAKGVNTSPLPPPALHTPRTPRPPGGTNRSVSSGRPCPAPLGPPRHRSPRAQAPAAAAAPLSTVRPSPATAADDNGYRPLRTGDTRHPRHLIKPSDQPTGQVQ